MQTRMIREIALLMMASSFLIGCGEGHGEDQDTGTGTDTDTELDGTDDTPDLFVDVPLDSGDADADAGDVPAEEIDDAADALDFEWDAPEMPDRYGYFQVQQVVGPTGAVSFAGGDFGDYGAVVPERPLWAGEGCSVVVYHGDPPDPDGFSRLSAGSPITISGGAGSHGLVSCTFDDLSGYICDLPATAGTTVFGDPGGETLTFAAPGEDVVAFGFDVVAPPPAVIVGSPTTIDRSDGYSVSWEAVDARGMIVALVVGDYAAGLEGGTAIQCQVDLSVLPSPTSFTFPDIALSLLDNTGPGPGGTFNVGIMQVMATETHNETLADLTVLETLVMNGAAVQVNVVD